MLRGGALAPPGLAADGAFDVLPRHPQVPLSVVEPLGGLVVHGPLVGLRAARLRPFVLGRGFDPDDLLAHPLLHGRQVLPAEALRPHPPSEVVAPVYDATRLGRQRAAGLLEVEPDEVEGRCHSTGQAGHQEGAIPSSCSCRSFDSAPADDSTRRPSERR